MEDDFTANEIFDETATQLLGVNRSAGRCLDIIERSGPLPAGSVARLSGLSSGSVTAILDHLERVELVERFSDPDDRRRVLVKITTTGEQACERIWGPLAAEGAVALETLSDEEKETVHRFLRTTRDLLERHRERISRDLDRGGG